jgi:hypothetical protein
MYGKLFSSMYDGTLATVGPWEALVTFQQLIILADKFGVVDMTSEAIARRTTLPLEIVVKGLQALEMPDPHSRTPDEDGRRIVRLSDSRPWGWRVVNHTHYRGIRSGEERREYMKLYQREYRKQRKPSVNTVNPGQPDQPIKPISESRMQNAECKKQSAISDKPKRPSRQGFKEWFEEIKKSPAYEGIDCERELEKMKVWFTTPKARGRKLSKTFALNWLNKIDPGESAKETKNQGQEGERRKNLEKQTTTRPPAIYCHVPRSYGCLERKYVSTFEEASTLKKQGWKCEIHKGLPMEFDEITEQPK